MVNLLQMAQPIDFPSSEDEIRRRDTSDYEKVAEEKEEEHEETDYETDN